MAAMSLGQLDGGEYKGTNPLTMAAAYGVFGNNGIALLQDYTLK